MNFRAIVVVLFGAVPLLTAQEEQLVPNDSMRPVYVSEIEYPLLAIQAQLEGVVVVRVKLDDEGKVLSTIAISGPTQLLLPAALSNASKWRFQTQQ